MTPEQIDALRTAIEASIADRGTRGLLYAPVAQTKEAADMAWFAFAIAMSHS